MPSTLLSPISSISIIIGSISRRRRYIYFLLLLLVIVISCAVVSSSSSGSSNDDDNDNDNDNVEPSKNTIAEEEEFYNKYDKGYSSSSSSALFFESSSSSSSSSRRRKKIQILITLLIIVICLVYGVICPKPIQQPLWYHNFADQRSSFFFGCCCCGCTLPNYNDVLSNIPFAIVSLLGICHLFMVGSCDDETNNFDCQQQELLYEEFEEEKEKEEVPLSKGQRLLQQLLLPSNINPPVLAKPEQERRLWLVYYVSVGLVSLGSTYYHLKPNNGRLVFDRLPMTVAFVSLTAIILQETVCDISTFVFIIMILIGISTVIYWHIVDDLRPYAIIQVGSILSIPICYGLFGSIYYYDDNNDVIIFRRYMEAILLYVSAKITETYDKQIFISTGNRVSGHTLKHLLSSIAAGWSMIILSSRSINIQQQQQTTKIITESW